VNNKIFAQEVVVIDENGESLGQITTSQALARAKESELDLVEVSPKADPPICKIMDYGSFKYQREKAEKKQKSKTAEIKTVKISARISDHDLELRVNNAVKFLNDGDKVKIEVQLKGRENQHANLTKENVKKMVASIGAKLEGKTVKTEQEIVKLGNKLSTIISV